MTETDEKTDARDVIEDKLGVKIKRVEDVPENTRKVLGIRKNSLEEELLELLYLRQAVSNIAWILTRTRKGENL